MRLIHKSEVEAERINLILLIALLLAVGAAISYLGASFSIPQQTAGNFGPISAW